MFLAFAIFIIIISLFAKMMKIDIPYYEDNTRISNSAIGWFLKKGPRYLRDMLDGNEEGISGKFLEKGTMIHEYILQPEEFWKDYEILDFEVPKVKQQKELCEYYSTHKLTDPLADEEKLLLDAYNSAYNNSKGSEIKKAEAKHIVETYSQYITYLQVSSTKKVISFADLTMLKQIKETYKNIQRQIICCLMFQLHIPVIMSIILIGIYMM